MANKTRQELLDTINNNYVVPPLINDVKLKEIDNLIFEELYNVTNFGNEALNLSTLLNGNTINLKLKRIGNTAFCIINIYNQSDEIFSNQSFPIIETLFFPNQNISTQSNFLGYQKDILGNTRPLLITLYDNSIVFNEPIYVGAYAEFKFYYETIN